MSGGPDGAVSFWIADGSEVEMEGGATAVVENEAVCGGAGTAKFVVIATDIVVEGMAASASEFMSTEPGEVVGVTAAGRGPVAGAFVGLSPWSSDFFPSSV